MERACSNSFPQAVTTVHLRSKKNSEKDHHPRSMRMKKWRTTRRSFYHGHNELAMPQQTLRLHLNIRLL
ncbi:hypothetical protein ONE63_010342 [Megalurothrips usitatus]|uniref:Uncharacterized protein n=1 Tax=Megalurothrips usitatus TaxID=439358 RepID=A0AAV7XHI5_9NEOP|nr:hypothetical protein ONE63_010342 [Megalurothrips usitatus]